jgi:FAD/FMN-containing dehydrogenase
MPEPRLRRENDRPWVNWHNSRDVGGRVQRFYTPMNAWLDAPTPAPPRDWEPGLAGLQRIVHEAEAAGTRVRAVGSAWSLSNAAFVPDFLVDTAQLSTAFAGFGERMVDPAFHDRRQRLVFAQCGVQIKTLNRSLEQQGLALPTSGASNGQTIVGAMSTGTHGSAHAVGAIPDYMLGLHVVAEGGKSYWIERASRPAMSPAFADWLGAELLRDDDLFLAAVVGFGSFGLIHAVVFEAAPLYLLELFVKQLDFQDVVQAALTRQVAGLGLPRGAEVPFHFEVVINPYRRLAGEGGAFVRVLYQRPATTIPTAPVAQGETLKSNDLVGLASFVSDAVPTAVPGLLQNQLWKSLAPGGASHLGTPGQTWGDSSPTGGGTSTEIGVPLPRLAEALDAIWSVTDGHTFGAPVALRYVRGSDALLAFTCFSPITCTIELPGIDSLRARQGQALVFQELRARAIPHTFHWGQNLPLDPGWLSLGLGQPRVDRWLAARRKFLSPAGRRMFSNGLLDACGLSG